METLLAISVALSAGLLMSRVVKPLKLPAVTGYLVAGILIGPYCLGQLGIKGIGFINRVNNNKIMSDTHLWFTFINNLTLKCCIKIVRYFTINNSINSRNHI